MVSKGITIFPHTAMFNKYIRDWRRQTTNQNTWATYKTFFRRSHCEQRRAVTTAGKGGYTAAVQNVYGVTPLPLEEHQEVIDNLNTIFQGMQTHSYKLERMEQYNAVLTSSKSAVMAHLTQTTVAMNAIQAQINILSSSRTNQTRSNRKYHCWSCGINYTHRIKPCSAKKLGHWEEVWYKKILVRSKKGCKWRVRGGNEWNLN